MKEELKEKNRNVLKSPVKGKHSGSRQFKKENSAYSDIDIIATVRNKELKLKRYRRKQKAAILFVVDGSRSQGSKERLSFAKSAVMAILKKSYSERDRVAMIVFGDKKAELVLPYTKSVDFAADKMKSLKAKGNTPLAMAMRLASKVCEQDIKKYENDTHIIVLLTDGKSNYDEEQGKPVELTKEAAENFKNKKLPLLVIDTENSIFNMGLAAKIASEAKGKYVTI